MRTHQFLSLGLLVLALGGCSRPEAPSELHWRFAGSAALKAQTNAPVLAEALKLPQSAAVLAPLSARLSDAWWHLGSGGKPASLQDLALGSALIPDLLSLESTGELLTHPKSGTEFVVAIRGQKQSSAAWEKQWTAWVQALHTARGGGGTPATLRQDDWLIAVSDSTLTPPQQAWKRISARAAEPGASVQFDVQYPGRLGLKAVMTCKDGSARWTATTTLARPIATPLPAWELPNSIREPLVFFTGVRAVPSLLPSLPWIQAWAGKILPTQAFAWGQPGNPESGHTYFAARMEDPVAALTILRDRLTPLFPPSASARYKGEVQYDNTVARVTLAVPLPVVPTFDARKEGNRGYLAFGFIPQIRSTNSLAPEMMSQLNRNNLIYYDWEFTSAAALHWHLLGQIEDLMEGRQGVISTPATQWLLAAAPKCGETVTEGLVTAPNTITLRRKSPLGLSGLELAALARWIDPEPPVRKSPPSSTNAPAAKKKR